MSGLLFQVVRQTWGSSGRRLQDCILYTGALGTAYLVLKAYEITHNENDLKLCSEIIKSCDSATRSNGYNPYLYFLSEVESFEL